MYERLVRNICKGFEQLTIFVPSPDGEAEESLADNQDSVPSAEIVSAWLDVRDHTWNLYEKLSHIWFFNCALPTNHQAQIRLSLPPVTHGNHGGPSFNYSFLVPSPRSNGGWRDVTISSRYAQSNIIRHRTSTYRLTSWSTYRAKRTPSPAKMDRKGKKKARFYELEIRELSIETVESATVPETEIFNICQTIAQTAKEGSTWAVCPVANSSTTCTVNLSKTEN